MQRNFDNKDFEQFLKTNADQYRMYPSEKVWNEIHNSLHSRRRWTGIAVLLLLVTGGIVTGTMLLNPSPDKNTITNKETKKVPALTKKTTTSTYSALMPVLKNVDSRSIASNKIPSIIPDAQIEEDITASGQESTVAFVPLQTADIKNETLNPEHALSIDNSISELLKKSDYSAFPINNIERNSLSSVLTSGKSFIFPIDNPIVLTSSRASTTAAQKKTTGKKKFGLQLYFTPGISYRRLTENKEVILAASGTPSIPSNIALQDVKNVVRHKPDVGFELGLAGKYSVTKYFAVKAGVQFNVNRYDIRAFSYAGERATIAIESSNQPILTTSYYRNSSGYKPNWLTNVYFSFSMPVGAEFTFLNTKKIDLGLGLTGQPTYLLDDRAYLISTDYKNYVRVPDLIRRWNLNAGAELIVGIKSGNTRWQVGPQIRYQALSSFKDKYPVKENLFNFGVKVGVSLNQ